MKNIISEIILLDKPVSSVNDIGHPWDLVANISAIFNDIPSSFKDFEHVIINDNNGPVIIGKNGVEKIEEINLDDNEKKEFMNSIDSVKKLWKAASSLDPSLSK